MSASARSSGQLEVRIWGWLKAESRTRDKKEEEPYKQFHHLLLRAGGNVCSVLRCHVYVVSADDEEDVGTLHEAVDTNEQIDANIISDSLEQLSGNLEVSHCYDLRSLNAHLFTEVVP